jgi:hypothetical protein
VNILVAAVVVAARAVVTLAALVERLRSSDYRCWLLVVQSGSSSAW